MVILNGDIIDIWQFSKRYWPKSHMKVIKQIINWTSKGIKTYYITGNHDEMLRKFTGFELGSLEIVNNLVLELNGEKTWFFHGDVFDVIIQHSKWLAKIGAAGYGILILLNRFINVLNSLAGRGKISLSKIIKENVKSAVTYISSFEDAAAKLALRKGYKRIVCGHIHHAEIRSIYINHQSVKYMNSGDWVESLTALEYRKKKWNIFRFSNQMVNMIDKNEKDKSLIDYDSKELFKKMLDEFHN
jgi:UDP-2,3-diacylglucosamine pyrophosphatase LpxH